MVLIEGAGRSGSTLLQRMIAKEWGAFALGELARIWDHGFIRNELCSCGVKMSQCEFWRPIFVKWSARAREVRDIVEDRDGLLAASNRRVIRSSRQVIDSVFARAHFKLLGDIASRAHEVTGTNSSRLALVADSTKHPNYGVLMREGMPETTQAIHLVRDPAAVCYSLGRVSRRWDVHWKAEYMPRYSPLRGALAWRRRNAALERVFDYYGRPQRVRYEDLVKPSDRGFPVDLNSDGLEQGSHHIIAGNPRKLDRVAEKLREDTEWKEAMSTANIAIVRLVTSGLARRYGYPLPGS